MLRGVGGRVLEVPGFLHEIWGGWGGGFLSSFQARLRKSLFVSQSLLRVQWLFLLST